MRGGKAHCHLMKRSLAVEVALDVLLHRRAKPRPHAIEQTGGVEVRLIRDAIVRELLSRDLAGGVEEQRRATGRSARLFEAATAQFTAADTF